MFVKFRDKSVNDIFINFSHFLDHFMMLIFAKAAYDAGRSFGMGYEEIITYGTLSFILFGACAPVAARLSDVYSRSLLMVVFHFGIGISAVLASFAANPLQLMIYLALLGGFAAIFHPVGIAMLLKSNKRRGLRLGINGVFGNLGVAAAPLFIGIVLIKGDWRFGFCLSGIICLFYGFIFLLNLKEQAIEENSCNNFREEKEFSEGWQRVLLALALVTTAGGFVFGSMTFLVPRYFEISMVNISQSAAFSGFLASLVFAIASFSQVYVGWLIDRISPKRTLLAMAAGQIIFVYFSAQYLDAELLIIMTLAMCFVFGQIPITDAIMARYVPDEYRGRVLSIKFLLNLTVGAMVLPFCGYLLQIGYVMSDLFFIISIVASLIFLAGLVLPEQEGVSLKTIKD